MKTLTPTRAATAAVAAAAAAVPHHDNTVSSTRVVARTRRGNALLLVIAAVVAATLPLLGATPAKAATYRDLKSVKYGTCLYNYADPLEDIYLKPCSTTPAKYGNWQAVSEGSYNGHPLWALRRQSGNCLGVRGSSSSNYLYVSCTTSNWNDWWEVFTTSTGRYVLKSYGAWRSWGQHKCLTFAAAGGTGSARLGACSLTSTTDQIYK
jgi:hypothetical protein